MESSSSGPIPVRPPRPWTEVLVWIDDEVDRRFARSGVAQTERDDVRGNVTVRLLRYLPRFDPSRTDATFQTWVRKQVSYAVGDYWRARARRAERSRSWAEDPGNHRPRDESPLRGLQLAELGDALRACLERLTASRRERFLATHHARQSGGSEAQLARDLRISRDTLKESNAASRVSLRNCLRAGGHELARAVSLPPDRGPRAGRDVR